MKQAKVNIQETQAEDRGPVWTGINEICRHFGDKSSLSVMNYRRDLDCPLIKDGGIWIAYEREIMQWAADLGIQDIREIDHAKVFKVVCRRLRSGPGRIIRGDMNRLCEFLRIGSGTMIDAQKGIDNPFKKIEGNQYEVDFNRWQDWAEDHHLRG